MLLLVIIIVSDRADARAADLLDDPAMCCCTSRSHFWTLCVPLCVPLRVPLRVPLCVPCSLCSHVLSVVSFTLAYMITGCSLITSLHPVIIVIKNNTIVIIACSITSPSSSLPPSSPCAPPSPRAPHSIPRESATEAQDPVPHAMRTTSRHSWALSLTASDSLVCLGHGLRWAPWSRR